MVFAGVGQDVAASKAVEAGLACKAEEDDGASVSTGVDGTSVGGYSSSDASGMSVAEWRVRAEAVMGSGMDRDAQLDQLGELVSSLHSMPRADPAECAYANIIQPEDLKPFENLLRQACEDDDGVFDMRGAVGREWETEVRKNPELKASYKQVGRNYEKQRLFRAEWASNKWKVCKAAKLEEKVQSAKDVSIGCYKTVSYIAGQQGFDASGVRAAQNYVAQCVERFMQGHCLLHHL